MAARIRSVSVSEEIDRLIVEKNISPSHALRVGVMKLAFVDVQMAQGETIIHETEIAKREKAIAVLQRRLLELEDEKNGR